MTRYTLIFLLTLMGGCATQKPAALIPFADGEYWVLGDNLEFTVRQTGQRIVVPRGFVTDFASVPRVFWTIFPKHGEYTRAAIVHDFLYWEQRCSRDQADELFDIVMEDSEVDSTTRFTIYAAVRVWGSSAWEENSERKRLGYVRIIPENYMNFPIKTRWSDYSEFLHKMLEGSVQPENFTGMMPPAYCQALQEKTEESAQPLTEPGKDEEPEELPPTPQERPVPESAIGA